MAEPRSMLQPVDDAVRAEARRLTRAARFGAIAVLEPHSGVPLVSRTAVATDIDGAPVMLMSRLSAHTAALDGDPRCSLLLGEPGRGDPLAHPRITVIGEARRIDRDSPSGARVRARYLARHPKAQLYVDFADFGFFRLEPARASLNGGFGKASLLERTDLLGASPAAAALAQIEADAIAHMNADHADAVGLFATVLCRAPAAHWRIVTIDAQGLELAADGETDLRRLDFDVPLESADALRPALVALARRARGGN